MRNFLGIALLVAGVVMAISAGPCTGLLGAIGLMGGNYSRENLLWTAPLVFGAVSAVAGIIVLSTGRKGK